MFASGKTAAVVSAANYIEDVFSTYLYTGNGFYPSGGGQTITNGIDLAGKGGLIWIKARSTDTRNGLYDTARGINKMLGSDSTAQEYTDNAMVSANSNGFTLGAESSGWTRINLNGEKYASWTFRKQPKFFDVVTWTGTGSNTTISHSLGSVPACIMVKRTDTTGDWQVYHSSLANTEYLVLNTTAAKATGATRWNSTTPTSTVFSIGTDATVNASGGSYVAYLFAHDAGGFGLTGTDNVISCGSFTTTSDGTPTIVNLGYEPQWLLVKKSSSSGEWFLLDTMRGMSMTSLAQLYANQSYAENTLTDGYVTPTATGFNVNFNYLGTSATCIYIAIRRGPMKVPTSGTSVFSPLAVNNLVNTVNTTNFPIDLQWYGNRNGDTLNITTVDRLRGVSSTGTQQQNYLRTTSTAAEVTTGGSSVTNTWDNTGFKTASLQDGADAAYWNFQRAPSFFDVVCDTCPASGDFQINHALGVVPEFVITKSRSNSNGWFTYHKDLGRSLYLRLNTTAAQTTGTDHWNTPTTTTFGNPVGNFFGSGYTAVFYLFATCAGVSKVGSYTGTGTTKQIDCGFAAGARFVLIKRTDSTGDWYVWDTARGIVSGDDPYLLLNSTAAEVTNTDYVDTYSAGFEISSTAPAAINASGGTFIFLAIA